MQYQAVLQNDGTVRYMSMVNYLTSDNYIVSLPTTIDPLSCHGYNLAPGMVGYTLPTVEDSGFGNTSDYASMSYPLIQSTISMEGLPSIEQAIDRSTALVADQSSSILIEQPVPQLGITSNGIPMVLNHPGGVQTLNVQQSSYAPAFEATYSRMEQPVAEMPPSTYQMPANFNQYPIGSYPAYTVPGQPGIYLWLPPPASLSTQMQQQCAPATINNHKSPEAATQSNVPEPKSSPSTPQSACLRRRRRLCFVNNILYKTEMCKDHKKGHCPRGSECQYSHGLEELRDPKEHPLFQTTTCSSFWRTGKCERGDRCFHIHAVNKNLKSNKTGYQPEGNNAPEAMRNAPDQSV